MTRPEDPEATEADEGRRTGRCLCGAIAFATRGPSLMSAFCHCPSCRRASGAPVVAWAMFPSDRLEITRGEPRSVASSPGVRRRFCGDCGTALFFESKEIEGLVDVTIASFDDPEALAPAMHIWDRHRLEWLDSGAGLPRHPELPPTE